MGLELITKYEEALQAIYDHVGFKEDWVIAPLDNCLEMYWDVRNGSVIFSKTIEGFHDDDSHDHYRDELYTQRFYNKWVYEGNDFTMVFCDPHVDGMKWFRLFDNSKRIRE